MDQPPKNKKRIVSKGQYVQAQGKRIGIGSAGVGLLFLSALFALFAFLSIGFAIVTSKVLYGIFVGVVCAAASFQLGSWGLASLRHANTIDPGVPLTRQVADTLPAEESLVRASEEPVQEQQAVLLRAATSDRETPSDQLVRPAGEQEP